MHKHMQTPRHYWLALPVLALFLLLTLGTSEAAPTRAEGYGVPPRGSQSGPDLPPPATCVANPDFTYTRSEAASIVPGIVDTGNHCEFCTTTLTLPFPVQFYGQTFTTANVSSNGNIQFLSDDSSWESFCGNYPYFNYAVMPYSAYMNTEQGGIFTSVSGTAPNRIFNIEWRACVHDPITYDCDQQVDFEARLYENSPTEQIDFVYGQVDSGGGGPAIVQVQQDTGSHITTYSCYQQNVLSAGTLISFNRDTCAPPPATPTGTPPTATSTPTSTNTPTPTPTMDSCHNVATWANEPPLSTGRSKPVGAVVADKFYVIGGSNSSYDPPYISAVERFDPTGNIWSTVAPIPTPAENMGAAVVGNKIYVAGGYTVRGGYTIDTMQVYDASNNSWTLASPLPAARNGAGVASFDGKVYIIGGSPDYYGLSNTVFEYDPATDTYTTKNPMPVSAANISAVTLGNLIYVVGGNDSLSGASLHYAYDPATDTWSSIASGPDLGFSSGGGFAFNGEVWLVAGTHSGSPYPPDQQVLIYNPAQNSWRNGPSLNTPRFWTSAVGVINGHAYLVGGIDSSTPYPPYNYLSSLESISYQPCGSVTPTATATPTIMPTSTGTAPTLTSTETATYTPTATSTACGFPTHWDSEAPSNSPGAYEGGVVVDNKLYVVGGLSGVYTATGSLQRFDPAAGTWTDLAPMPTPLSNVQAVSIGTTIYVRGDVNDPNLQIYDTATDTWSVGAAPPQPRDGTAISALNGKIYLFGGEDSTRLATTTVYGYDPQTGSFTLMAPMPVANSYVAAVPIGNLIYVVGGPANLAHHIFDPSSNSWTSIARAPLDHMYAPGAFVLNGELWTEGATDPSLPLPAYQEVQIYNPNTRLWRFGPEFATPRHASTATGVVGGRAYVAGGRDDATGDFLASVESIAWQSCGATSTPTTTSHPIFKDVHPSDYFYEGVVYLRSVGAISGYQDGTFRPYNYTSRGQLSKIIVLAQEWPIDTTGAPHFTDVPVGSPFYPYVETAFNRGIISGYSDGTFRPARLVTRGQICKIVTLAQAWPIDTTGNPHFADVPVGSPFYPYIETAFNRGVIFGYSDGTFKPGNPATRGQISKIEYTAMTGH